MFCVPYCLMTRPKKTRIKEQLEDRQYWIQNLCDIKKDSVVIRLEPGCAPWVEKRCYVGAALKELYEESMQPEKWCANIIRAMRMEKNKYTRQRVGKYGWEFVVNPVSYETRLLLIYDFPRLVLKSKQC